jgi:hypothetical protein
MKKIFLYSLMLLSAFAVYSCKDDDNSYAESADRLIRPQFRTRYTVSAGSSDPDLCALRGRNSIFLSWSLVKDAAGYEIKVSTQQKVNTGEEAWENPENVLQTYTLDADKDTMLLTNLAYNTNYRFAIRALSARGEAHNSQWWGYGDGQHWADYLGIPTDGRYPTPNIIAQISDNVFDEATGKASFRVYLNRAVDETDPNYDEWKQHFTETTDNEGNKVWKCDYFRIAASESSPGAEVPAEFTNHSLTDADFTRGYIDVTGLTQNSVYLVDVIDKDIPIDVDAVYNTRPVRTKGILGDPILLNAANGYVEVDTMVIDDVTYKFSDYENLLGPNFKATRLDKVLRDFMTDINLAENQVFYLEGDKIYFTTANTELYKGFTLMTNPEDIAAGKGKAKVFDLRNLPSSTGSPALFMLGRMPLDGENANIPIDIDNIIFENIDFDYPGAHNSFEGGATGNYLFNQYSGGMGMSIENFEIRGCSFQRFVRGFGRTQCKFGEFIRNFIVEDCEFYNCGGYGGNGSGYGFFTGDLNNPASNCFNNMIWRNNTFFDCPMGNFLTHGTGTGAWTDPSLVFHITIENNTFVNWNTYSGRPMLSFRSLPSGSTITIRKNLFVQVVKDGDERAMNLQGADIRTLNGVCEDMTTFDIHDNWSTNDNINEATGEAFTANAFSANKNSFGAFTANSDVLFPAGVDELKLHIADIKAADLMESPYPPIIQQGDETSHVHHTGSIDGTTPTSGVNSLIGGTANLYFKNFDNDIVKNEIGASKWRTKK